MIHSAELEKIDAAIRALLERGDVEQALLQFRRMGMSNPPAAVASTRRFQHLTGDVESCCRLIGAIAASYEAGMCINNWERFVNAAAPEQLRRVLSNERHTRNLSLLFSFSQTICDQLFRSLAHLDYLLDEETLAHPRRPGEFDAALQVQLAGAADATGADGLLAALGQFKQREMLRIATRDMLGLAPLEVTVNEIAELAVAIVRRALQKCLEDATKKFGPPQYQDQHGKTRTARFAVIGMGKLGGHELNVSSDLDLIFVYDHEGQTAGVELGGLFTRAASNHQYFVTVAESLIRMLSGAGGADKLYRIDARLRPEGAGGPLARSLESYETYYLTQARIWEKVALSKARGIAGNRDLMQAFEVLTRRFVYDANPVRHLLREIWRLKERIDREVYRKGIERQEVKRGYGGIREIEFQVAALQLIHGKSNLSIRRRSCLPALEALKTAGLMSDRQSAELHAAYIWLRTVEHRLQYLYDQQEHCIPSAPEGLEALARRCGIEPAADRGAADVFQQRHRQHTETVHRWFLDTFAAAADSVAADEQRDELWLLLHTEIDPEQALRILQKYRLRQAGAVKTIRRLAYGTSDRYITAEGQQFFEIIFPRLMDECAKVPWADKVLNHFESFMLNSGGITPYYSLIVDYPPLLRLLCKIFGSSDYLAKILIRHPEYLDLLVQAETLERPAAAELAADEILGEVLRARADEVAQNRMRRFYKKQLLRIGARFILGLAEQDAAAHALTQLLRILLQTAFRRAERQLVPRYGRPRRADGGEPEFLILGLGKIGAGELSFHSDLDLVYVYEGEGKTAGGEQATENFIYYSRLIEHLQELLEKSTSEGKIADVDPKLRPEGKSGPLVINRERLFAYFAGEEAQPWEYQAYLRMSPAFGSTRLFEEFSCFFWERAITLKQRVALKPAILEMRRRLEQSVQLPGWAACDLKRGPGGVVDVEFLAQWIQLEFGEGEPRLRNLATDAVLQIALAAGWLPAPEIEHLRENFRCFRLIEMTNQLLFESVSSLLPADPERLDPLQTALRDHQLDLDSVPQRLSSTREIFTRWLG